MRVLLVDDSRAIVAAFSARLAAMGHELFSAPNGAEAIERFRELSPDLVLMGIEVPVMNGFEAVRHIRASTGRCAACRCCCRRCPTRSATNWMPAPRCTHAS